MEHAAIKHITDLAIAAQNTLPVQVDVNASLAIVPESFKVISTEKFNPQRDRFRGVFTTIAIASFIKYANDRGVDELKTFINTKNQLSATAVFNLGNTLEAGHADDIAVLNLEKTPEYVAFEQANGKRYGQQDLVDLLDDWVDFITPHNANGPIESEKAIRALRKVKITKGQEVNVHVHDLGYQASAAEQVEAKGIDDDLPSHFILHTESYKGLPSSDLKFSLRLSSKDTEPTFILRFVGKDAHDQRRADEFITILEEQLATAGQFYQGGFTA